MKKMKALSLSFIFGFIGLFILVLPAYAVNLVGSGIYGSFEGEFIYEPSLARLKVTLKNTSSYGDGGYITAFVFNNPKNPDNGLNRISTVTWASVPNNPSDSDFSIDGGPAYNNTIIGSPYGRFDIGASTGGSFEGGGAPSLGIPYNVSETFIFFFTGTGLDALNEYSFLNELSEPPGGGQGYKSFVVRFRGLEPGDKSDHVPGYPRNGEPIPEPASLSLLGLGLLGLLGFRKKRL